MAGGNEVSVSVGAGNTITVAVAGSTGTTPTITNGGTATVTVTSVGDRGPQGDAGPATTLAIGTVTTGEPGSSASAALVGSPPAQTLSLTIPRGDAGAAGTNGTNGTFADAQQINARTASYTLAISDAGKLITASHASTAITITVPAGSSVAFPVGTHIDIARLGVAEVTIVGASGVTVNGTPGLKLRAQYSAATLIGVAADSWLLVGDLSA
jgi:hypothetical protein